MADILAKAARDRGIKPKQPLQSPGAGPSTSRPSGQPATKRKRKGSDDAGDGDGLEESVQQGSPSTVVLEGKEYDKETLINILKAFRQESESSGESDAEIDAQAFAKGLLTPKVSKPGASSFRNAKATQAFPGGSPSSRHTHGYAHGRPSSPSPSNASSVGSSSSRPAYLRRFMRDTSTKPVKSPVFSPKDDLFTTPRANKAGASVDFETPRGRARRPRQPPARSGSEADWSSTELGDEDRKAAGGAYVREPFDPHEEQDMVVDPAEPRQTKPNDAMEVDPHDEQPASASDQPQMAPQEWGAQNNAHQAGSSAGMHAHGATSGTPQPGPQTGSASSGTGVPPSTAHPQAPPKMPMGASPPGMQHRAPPQRAHATGAQNHPNMQAGSSQTNAQTGEKPNARSNAQPDTQPGVSQAHAQHGGGSQPGGSQPGGSQPHAQTGSQANAQTGSQANAQTGSQPHAQTGSQANAQTGSQPHAQTGSQANAQTGSQANTQTGGPQTGGSAQTGSTQPNMHGSATGAPQTNASSGPSQGAQSVPSANNTPAVDPAVEAFFHHMLESFGTTLMAGFSGLAERVTMRFENAATAMNESLTQIHNDMKQGAGEQPSGRSQPRDKPVPDDGSEPFDPANPGTSSRVKLDSEELLSKKLVRQHLQSIFDARGAGQYGPDVSLQLISDVNDWVKAQTGNKKRLNRSFKFVIPKGMKASNIGIDYKLAGPKSSGYNRLMAQIFTEDFMASGKAQGLTEDEVMDLFFRRVKSLKKQRADDEALENYAGEMGVDKEELEETRAQQAAIEQRSRSLFHRRLTVADELQKSGVDPKGMVLRLVRGLGFDGTSDDEEEWVATKKDPFKRKRKRIVVDLAWRDRKCRFIFSALDDLYEWTESKHAMGSPERRGALPERRYFYEENDRDEDAVAPSGLPWNIYDQDWVKAKGQTYMQTVIRPRKTPFEVPESFWEYYRTMSRLWIEHTSGHDVKGKGKARAR